MNSIVLSVAVVSFNCLRMVGKLALSKMEKRLLLGKLPLRNYLCTMLLDFTKVSCKVLNHTGNALPNFDRNSYYILYVNGICVY